MLFNADKQVKDNLFNMYQQDIMQRRQRKDDFLIQEKQSDKVFLEQLKRKNEEENQKKTFEKQRRINENMQEYNQFWQKKDEDRKNRFSKIQEVNINSYALNNNNFQKNNSNSNYNSSPYENNNGSNNFNANPNIRTDLDSKKDHINPIMNPDYIGIRKIEDLEKNKKMEDQRIYRNMLDAQMSLKPSSNDWNSVNRDNTISLMALNKRNNNEEMFNKNPYSSKTYNIGTSQLSYNPITDPRNNIHYNKYLPINQIKSISTLPTMPTIQNNQISDYQNFNQNSNNNNNNSVNNNQMPYNNNIPMDDYPSSDYYGNTDPRQMNNNINYGNEMGMGMNMLVNPSPNNYNIMNTSAYNRDDYTPQTRDRLRMAGNNIFK